MSSLLQVPFLADDGWCDIFNWGSKYKKVENRKLKSENCMHGAWDFELGILTVTLSIYFVRGSDKNGYQLSWAENEE